MEITTHHYPAGLEQPRHGHADAGFSIVLAGSLVERVGRTEVLAGPLSVVCKPVDTEHANRFGPEGATVLRVSMHGSESRQLVLWAGSLRTWRWIHGGAASRAFLCLARIGGTAPDSPDTVGRAVWDALGALEQEASRQPTRPQAPPRWLRTARETIDDALETPRVGTLAREAGVHPVYLARQFRRFFGSSVSEYVQRARVRRTAALLARKGSISQVSFAAGFADHPHMCRVFRRETGLTPRQYRHLLACDGSPADRRTEARGCRPDGRQ